MQYWVRFYRDFDDPGSHVGAAAQVEAADAPAAAAAIAPAAIAEAKRNGAAWLVVFNRKAMPVHRAEI